MKPQYGALSLLVLIPFIYFAGYAGFLLVTAPSAAFSHASFMPPGQRSVITRNRPAREAVKVFEPAMKVHAKLSGKTIRISIHEFG